MLVEFRDRQESKEVPIDRDLLAAAVKRGGPQAIAARRLIADWTSRNIGQWESTVAHAPLGAQHQIIVGGPRGATKTGFTKMQTGKVIFSPP